MQTKLKIVNLVGDLCRPMVDDYRTILKEEIDKESSILASLTQVEDIDLFGIQLLYAARRYADSLGKSFSLTGDVAETVGRRFFEAGFSRTLVRDGQTLTEILHDFSVPEADQDG